MKKKSYASANKTAAVVPVHHLGLKAFYLEPLLVLGASILWLAVLPFAGLFWSGDTLLKRVGSHT